MLNIPLSVNKKLDSAKSILIVGAGGDQNILCGIPLYYTFLKQGKNVHLANLTHTDLKNIHQHADPIVLEPNVLGANSIIKLPSQNYVEGYLSQFFKETLNQDKIVWMLNKTNVQDLKKAFEKLIAHLEVDAIVLVDGGIDSIMTGNEGREILTKNFVDTTLILAVIQQMEEIQNNCFFVCLNENLIDQMVINNILSNISVQGGFFGGSYMVNYMSSYKLMKSAYSYLKNSNNVSDKLEYLIKLTDLDYEEGELKNGLIQFLFFNPIALAYNNIIIHKIQDNISYYDIVQNIGPYLNKS